MAKDKHQRYSLFFDQGFTLIELLVVISIIAMLASVILVSLNSVRTKARDSYRKSELHQIVVGLEIYFTSYGSYPLSGGPNGTVAATGPQDAGSPPYHISYSTAADWLYPLVNKGIFSVAPKDPVNKDMGPWCWGGSATKSTIFTYTSDGTHYILCAWMENLSDGDTLQYNDVPNPWNPAQMLYRDLNYSKYNYVIAK